MYALQTSYGTLSGISSSMTYGDGSLKSCIFNAKNCIKTPVGDIVPQYRAAEFGERQKKHRSSLSFYEGGQLKSASLDVAMPLQTPLGVYKAEFVTFYPDGAVKRIFPLNGQIDGFWSEQMEGELAEVLDFDLPVGKFSAKIISLSFYPGGELKSITLWPGQRIMIDTPVGTLPVRTGFSLYEDGSVRSVEPARVVELPTPIGLIKAFDPEMIGMNAEQNSVQFTPEGLLCSVKTVNTGIRVFTASGEEKLIEPLEAASLIDINDMRTVPMQVDFTENAVQIAAAENHEFVMSACTFETFERENVIRESCGSCGGCNEGSASSDDGGCCGGGSCGGETCSDCPGDDTCCKQN